MDEKQLWEKVILVGDEWAGTGACPYELCHLDYKDERN
jgi:hypothetical protein